MSGFTKDMLKNELGAFYQQHFVGKKPTDNLTKAEIMLILNKVVENRQSLGENMANVDDKRMEVIMEKFDLNKDGLFNFEEMAECIWVEFPVNPMMYK